MSSSSVLWLYFILKMEAAKYSEMMVCYRIITQRHNPEYIDLNIHRRE
jgi:hypothetical protein